MRLDGQDYQLVPLGNRSQHTSTLRTHDDGTFQNTEYYKYKKLDGARKKIRLLQLKGGAIDAPDIYCELMEADYDNRFHMPTSLGAPEMYKGQQNTKGMTPKEIMRDNINAYNALSGYEIKYEALSWCWGAGDPNYIILINVQEKGRDKLYKLRVREQLALALKYLRHADRSRTLWIDAICINQDDPSERNHQVQMMSRIYTRAQEVCIWLGDSDSDSRVAIPFIKEEIIKLHKFDHLCSDKRYTEKWKALMMLMQREWFSRRWVVQEIALADKATIYCGRESMEWAQFAVAVELFVEVESATHRLSEIMQKDVKFQHVPGWFEYVSDLGASLLVQATGKVFRARRSPLDKEDTPGDKKSEVLQERVRVNQTIDPLDRKSLLSLEYLVSTFFIFGASEPRDAVYAMLALSRDAAPLASSSTHTHKDDTRLMMMTCEPFLEEKPFTVDYRRPYSEVCKDFVSFAIDRRRKLDPSQALDVLCRPWALKPPESGEKSKRLKGDPGKGKKRDSTPRKEERHWKIRERDEKDPEHKYLEGVWKPDPRPMEKYWKESEVSWDKSKKAGEVSSDWTRKQRQYFPFRKVKVDKKEGTGAKESTGEVEKTDTGESLEPEEDMELPSWVAQRSRAPIRLDFSPGIQVRITVRSNADPLVGSPQDGHRNYSAAQTRPPKLLQFRRRPSLKHYSLFLNGFILDEVEEVRDASQGGNIPSSWLDLAGWTNTTKNPPSEFWRTLVADRGRDNRNPPYYYATACRESAVKGGIKSGRIDTAALINNERNSIVAEFCRRVHAVIWNRRLFKTRRGKLGLAIDVEKGDKVSILYGCTVPVVLRQHSKTREDRVRENEEDSVMTLRRLVQNVEMLCQRKADHKERNLSAEDMAKNEEARRKAIGMIKNLEGTQLAKGQRNSKGKDKGDSREGVVGEPPPDTEPSDVEEENSEDDLGDDRKDSDPVKDAEKGSGEGSGDQTHEGHIGHAQEQQSQPESSGDGGEADLSGTRDNEPRRMKRSTTTYEKKKLAAATRDPWRWYDFLGECYVHGMMDGEAIREQFNRQIVERKFELR